MLKIGWTTVSQRADAELIAHDLVSKGWVACAQIDGPLSSIYRWEGKTHEDQEYRLTLKFSAAAGEVVERRLNELHPYDVPQWIVVKADHVAEKYLSWAKANSSSLPFST